jgi:hypothetical protein
MRVLSKQELHDFMDQGFICLLDGVRIAEYDIENDILYSDFQEDKKFADIDFDFLVIYEVDEADSFNTNTMEIIKIIQKCIKEQDKFEKGKSCVCLIEDGCDIYTVENMKEMLSDIDFLYRKIFDLEICELRIVK